MMVFLEGVVAGQIVRDNEDPASPIRVVAVTLMQDVCMKEQGISRFQLHVHIFHNLLIKSIHQIMLMIFAGCFVLFLWISLPSNCLDVWSFVYPCFWDSEAMLVVPYLLCLFNPFKVRTSLSRYRFVINTSKFMGATQNLPKPQQDYRLLISIDLWYCHSCPQWGNQLLLISDA